MTDKKYTLGIDIGSTTVKIAILDEENQLLFCRLRAPFCKHPGNTCPSARGSPTKNWAN